MGPVVVDAWWVLQAGAPPGGSGSMRLDTAALDTATTWWASTQAFTDQIGSDVVDVTAELAAIAGGDLLSFADAWWLIGGPGVTVGAGLSVPVTWYQGATVEVLGITQASVVRVVTPAQSPAWPTQADLGRYIAGESGVALDPTNLAYAYTYTQDFAVNRCAVDPTGPVGGVAIESFLELGSVIYQARNRGDGTPPTAETERRRRAVAGLRGYSVSVG